jgi:hypothetical protein
MSKRFIVCNGDADGLCAAVQWLMHEPGDAELVTGLKRERALLGRVAAARGDEVNVFDLALAANREALQRLLDTGVRLRYFDHHAAQGDLPVGALLEAHVDTDAQTCTSLIVDQRVGGACHGWALVGAYGDNLVARADSLGAQWGFDAGDRARLRRLGEVINYNAYGDEGDQRIAPARLAAIMARHRDARDMLAQEGIVADIESLLEDDLRRGSAVAAHWSGAGGCVHVLPDAPWSRRVVGTLANVLAGADPARAHAVMRPARHGGYVVSVRAPLRAPGGADALCRGFGGAGRAAAAGIDALPAGSLGRFVDAFAAHPWREAVSARAG